MPPPLNLPPPLPDKLGAAGPSNSVPRRENPHRPHADLRWRGGRALVCATVPPSRIAIQNGLMLLRGAAVGPQATRGPGYQTSRKEHTPFDMICEFKAKGPRPRPILHQVSRAASMATSMARSPAWTVPRRSPPAQQRRPVSHQVSRAPCTARSPA